ncbi:hypothetical protein F5Y17DRAFT_144272 [Xylariaceae sp. FL0594]|nr:hypothetical protein F5Y17DRAFT_144272 [Xylariaceae sp. FL0594]
MAVRPGEENVATLFGDVHYFYGSPTEKPLHHRFDKGSYVYLFENANDRRARIEIANQPGTEDQDAFDGFLDRTRVRYSYKQQCLVNIIVDGIPGGSPPDPSQWHLPTYDPRNENIYHYRLHSLDIYFWTRDDALQFVNGIRRVLPAAQVEVADEPAAPAASPQSHGQQHGYSDSQDMVNPLVQRLESAAISGSVSSQPHHQQQQQSGGIPSFAPPPPPPPISGGGGLGGQPQPAQSPQSFAPMAYNPAAPPERERYQHREKTPPPEDDGHDPLAAALARDQAAPFSPGYGQTTFAPPGAAGIGGGGPMSPGLPPPVTSPGFPPSQYAHLQRAVTMPVLGSPGLSGAYYGGANYPGSPSFAPPPTTTTTTAGTPYQPTPPQQQIHATPTPPPSHGQPQQPQTPGLPPPPGPPGGYSQYSYGSPAPAPVPPGPQAAGVDYSVHQQVYRPTSQEYAVGGGHHHNKQQKPKPEGGDEKPSKLGQSAERLERGVTGMLRKFEKKFG